MKKLVRFDWAIKNLLRNKDNFTILEGFLSELLQTDIQIESILESESNENSTKGKFSSIDLLVQIGYKERMIIEIQCSTQWEYLSRILYGKSKAIIDHTKELNSYKDISKIISVSIVFFDLGEGKDYLYKGTSHFTGVHYHDELKLGINERKIYGPAKTLPNIFSEYYIIKVKQFNERIQNKFDEWVYFLKNSKIDPSFNAKGIQEAALKLNVLQLDDNKYREYEYYLEGLHYDASMALPYTINRDEGRAEGRKEVQAEVAINLKQMGLSQSQIAKAIGLNEEEIPSSETT